MKKALMSLVVLTTMVVFGAALAEAQESGTIAVTVTVTQSLAMTVGPDWGVTATTEGATESTWQSAVEGAFTLSNDGNGEQDYDIKASISGGCSLDPAAGIDQYAIGWGQAADPYDVEPAYTDITEVDAAMISNMAADAEGKFDMQIKLPSSTTYGGVRQTITVTITASAS